MDHALAIPRDGLLSGGGLKFESILQELGLVEPTGEASQRRGLASLFHYRPVKRPDKWLDRLSRPQTLQHFPGHEGGWEAFYAALWSSSMEATAEACGLSLRILARALDQPSPFAPRHVW